MLRVAIFSALLIDITIAIAFALPTAPIGSPWWQFATKVNGTLREEIGWPEFVETVAKIRDTLPAEDRAGLGILAGTTERSALSIFMGNVMACRAPSVASTLSGNAAMATRLPKR